MSGSCLQSLADTTDAGSVTFEWSLLGDPEAAEPGPSPSPERPDHGPLGPFVLRGQLGQGGMGVVYRAWDPVAEREVALKLNRIPAENHRRRERFRREGELTARLSHPGIVRVHSAGEVAGAHYIAYELVEDACELDSAFATRGLDARVELVLEAALALAHAHEIGVVHRDVKPANVLVDAEGRVRVADFGLGAARDLHRLTQTGAMVGTPSYMAPEQFGGLAEPGPGADVWGLGVILYQALTGALPFEGKTLLELGAQVTSLDPAPPTERAPEISPGLERVCLTALTRDLQGRYPHAGAMARDLQQCVRGEAPTYAEGLRGGRRWRGASLAALAVGAVTILLSGGLAWKGSADASAEKALRSQAAAELADLVDRGGLLERAHVKLASLQERLADPAAEGGPGQRVRALQALAALTRGDLAGAREQARLTSPASPEGLLVAACLSLYEGDRASPEALVGLEQLPELSFVELDVWRAQSRLRRGKGSPADRARGLSALRRIESGGRSCDRVGAIFRVEALLAEERNAAAFVALDKVGLPHPEELRYRVSLAKAVNHLESEDPEGALAILHPTSFPLTRRGPRLERAGERIRRGLWAVVRGTPSPGAEGSRAEGARMTALLRLSARFGLDLGRELVDRLLTVVSMRHRSIPVGVALSDAAPRDFALHAAMARQAKLFEGGDITTVVPVFERALRIAPDADSRRQIQVPYVSVLFEAQRDEEGFRLCAQVLPTAQGAERGSLLDSRSQAHARRGALELALKDMDAATPLLERFIPKRHEQRAALLRRLGRFSDAYTDLAHHGRVGAASFRHKGTVTILWGEYRATQAKDVLEAVERLQVHAHGGGAWEVRRAWLHLRCGQPAAAVAAFDSALRLKAQGNAPALAEGKRPRVRDLRSRLAAGQDVQAPLEALIAELDAALPKGYRPPGPPPPDATPR
jgi:hypothetical protein